MRGLDECVSYLKVNKGFLRLMEGLCDLYSRYERCFGAVRLVNPSGEEEKALSEFFKRDYYNQALIRIGLADFERQVQKVFSPDIRMGVLLEAYFGKQMTIRNSPRTVNAFTLFLESDLIPRYIGTEAEDWLREIAAHVRRVYRPWADRYIAEPSTVARTLITLCDILSVLPCTQGQIMRLPDFSKKYTGNPHMLDMSSDYGMLFLRALATKCEVPFPSTPEECCALYYKVGLLSEGVLSHVTVRGLQAYCGEALDEATQSYNQRNEAHVLTLENLNRFTQITAQGGRVFIMENLSVFSAVSEKLRDCPCTLVCADGGFNGAFMNLVDRFSESGMSLYYSGDMDYAGLCQADRLYLRHPRHFVPWRYGKADYDRIMSDTEFVLSEHKKEIGLYCEDLAALLSYMRKKGKIALQSALIADLADDIWQMSVLSEER